MSESEHLLELAARILQGLNEGTENAFLALGGQLADFLASIRQIRTNMTALRMMVAQRTESQAHDVLVSVLEGSKETEAVAEMDDRALATLYRATQSLRSSFSGFEGTVSAFYALGSSTRIEIGRLGSAGSEFGYLANEVNTLTQSIAFHGQGIINAFVGLHESMRSAIDGLSNFRAGGMKELPSLRVRITAGLASLEEQNRCAERASLDQAEEYEDVTVAIEDLIPAIQFHDITRQQIEHVVDELGRLRSEFEDRPGVFPEDIGLILALQSRQLSNAEKTFASSVERIELDLGNIEERVTNMAEESRKLWADSAGGQGAFFRQLEEHFGGILKILSDCNDSEMQTHAALADLTQTVARVQESIEEVRKIGSRIRRVAFNLVIRAVQIGSTGDVLGVLADVMKGVAVDAMSIADQVADALKEILSATSLFSEGPQTISTAENGDGKWALSKIRAYILDLRVSSETSLSQVNEIAALSAALREKIETARASLSVSHVFAREANRARSAIEELVQQLPEAAAETDGMARAARLERLEKQYTMTAEREIHSFINATSQIRELAAAGSPKDDAIDDPFGDNVEFF